MNRVQIRAARALLGWSQDDLAQASGVSLATIKRIEPGQGEIGAGADTIAKLLAALEEAGVEFIGAEDASIGGGLGVRLADSDRVAMLQSMYYALQVSRDGIIAAGRKDKDEYRRKYCRTAISALLVILNDVADELAGRGRHGTDTPANNVDL